MIRTAIVGCGYQTRKNMLPAMLQSVSVELAGLFDINGEASKSLAEERGVKAFDSYEQVLADSSIEAVYIATPTSSHTQICSDAAKAGKHILCEKSLAMNPAEVEEIVSQCVKAGVLVKEGFMYRHHTQHQFVKTQIEGGEIGTPFLFSASFGYPLFPAADFRMRKELGGGALLDAGAYVVNAARFIWGREPDGIASVIECNEQGLDIRGYGILSFGSEQKAQLAYGMNNSYKNTYTVWGTKGEITLLRAFSLPASEMPVCRIVKQGVIREYNLPACNHFVQELDAFSKDIASGDYDYDEVINQSIALAGMRKT